jgi:hypothetical protein
MTRTSLSRFFKTDLQKEKEKTKNLEKSLGNIVRKLLIFKLLANQKINIIKDSSVKARQAETAEPEPEPESEPESEAILSTSEKEQIEAEAEPEVDEEFESVIAEKEQENNEEIVELENSIRTDFNINNILELESGIESDGNITLSSQNGITIDLEGCIDSILKQSGIKIPQSSLDEINNACSSTLNIPTSAINGGSSSILIFVENANPANSTCGKALDKQKKVIIKSYLENPNPNSFIAEKENNLSALINA